LGNDRVRDPIGDRRFVLTENLMLSPPSVRRPLGVGHVPSVHVSWDSQEGQLSEAKSVLGQIIGGLLVFVARPPCFAQNLDRELR